MSSTRKVALVILGILGAVLLVCVIGVVLIWASITVMLVAGIVLAGTDRVKAMDEVSQLEWEARGQVYEVARAGLVDAYAWLRRQTSQPVTTFQPLRIGIQRPTYVAEPLGGFLTDIPVVTAVEDIVNEAVYKTHPRGFIGLQVHGISERELTQPQHQGLGITATQPLVVKWRNIRVRPL